MANETLYGCVKWPSGVIEFTQAPDCTYSACWVLMGIHAGQIAVTIHTLDCQDTYYGCIDWATGKFEVSVPDDCCTQPEPNCPCNSCESGFGGPGRQPDKITIIISGITETLGCFDYYLDENEWSGLFLTWVNIYLNRTWTLSHISGCSYESAEYDPGPSTVCKESHEGHGCSDLQFTYPVQKSKVTLSITTTGWPMTLTLTGWFYVGYIGSWRPGFHCIMPVGSPSGAFCIPEGVYPSNTLHENWIYDENAGIYIPSPYTGSAVLAVPTIDEGNSNICTS